MKICWVTNEQYYSKLMRWIFNCETTHVGAVFSIGDINLATDLNKPYGKVWGLHRWLHKYTVIHECEIPLNKTQEIAMYKACCDYCEMRPYDFNGYLYGMIRGLLKKFFNKAFPDKNSWSSLTGSMCQEVVVPIWQHSIIKSLGLNLDPYKADLTRKTPDMVKDMMFEATEDNLNFKWLYNG